MASRDASLDRAASVAVIFSPLTVYKVGASEIFLAGGRWGSRKAPPMNKLPKIFL